MKGLSLWGLIALILVLIGGINWLLIGLFNINVIAGIFGPGLFGRLIYIIVGIAAIYLIYLMYIDKSKPAA